MPKPLHKNWEGFSPIRNDNEVIKAARCHKCNNTLKRHDSYQLERHRAVCKGPATKKLKLSTQSPLKLEATTKDNIEIESEEIISTTGDGGQTLSKKTETTCKLSMQSPPGIKKVNEIEVQEKDSLFLKFVLYYNIDFDKVNDVPCTELLNALDPSYTIPKPEELQDRILKSTIESMYKKNIHCDLTNVLGVATCQDNNEIDAISFVISSKQEYLYIDKYNLDITSNDTSENLMNFFDSSIKKVKSKYAMEIRYVIYDGTINVQRVRVIEGMKYYVILSFTVLINTLRNDHPAFLVTSGEDLQKAFKYNKIMDELEKKVVDKTCTQADALEELLSLLADENNVLSINSSAITQIIEFSSPATLAANYLVHDLKGHCFMSYDPLTKIMYEFLYEATPDDGFDGLAQYKNQTGIFSSLFDPTRCYERRRFWNIAKFQEKPLSTFAMNLIELPATIRKLDFQSIKKNLSNEDDEKNELMRVLKISLFLN